MIGHSADGFDSPEVTGTEKGILPVGSSREGIFAEASDLLRRSFTAACPGCRP